MRGKSRNCRNPLDLSPLVQLCFKFLPIKVVFTAASVSKTWRDAAYNMPKDSFRLVIDFCDAIHLVDASQYDFELIASRLTKVSFCELPETARTNLRKFISGAFYFEDSVDYGDISVDLPNVEYADICCPTRLPSYLQRHICAHATLLKKFEFDIGCSDIVQEFIANLTFPNVYLITLHANNLDFRSFPNVNAVIYDDEDVNFGLSPMHLPETVKILILRFPCAGEAVLPLNWNADNIEILVMPIPKPPQVDSFREKLEECWKLKRVIFTGNGKIPENLLPSHMVAERRDRVRKKDVNILLQNLSILVK